MSLTAPYKRINFSLVTDTQAPCQCDINVTLAHRILIADLTKTEYSRERAENTLRSAPTIIMDLKIVKIP